MATAAPVQDRRHRRRQESIEEILDVAVDLMAENGVAGLSLGELARSLGIRPPSLYVYFASKNALYDALFARGAQAVLDLVRTESAVALEQEDDLAGALRHLGGSLIRWGIEHPVYTQLLFWRPVPGFAPSAEAYAPAVELIEVSRATFAELQDRGWIRRDVPIDDVVRDWTVVTGGITSQQLANAPEESFAEGRFTAALPGIVAMFTAYYAPAHGRTTTPSPGRKATTRRKAAHGNAR